MFAKKSAFAMNKISTEFENRTRRLKQTCLLKDQTILVRQMAFVTCFFSLFSNWRGLTWNHTSSLFGRNICCHTSLAENSNMFFTFCPLFCCVTIWTRCMCLEQLSNSYKKSITDNESCTKYLVLSRAAFIWKDRLGHFSLEFHLL